MRVLYSLSIDSGEGDDFLGLCLLLTSTSSTGLPMMALIFPLTGWSACFSTLDGSSGKRGGLLGITPLPSILEKSIQLAMVYELLNFILELDSLLHVMAMVSVVEAILVWIIPLWLHPQPSRLR